MGKKVPSVEIAPATGAMNKVSRRWRWPRSGRVTAGAVLLSACAVAVAQIPQASPAALKRLSLEQLANLPVTSVAKRPTRLSGAASAIQVITAEDIRRSGASSIPEALRLADNLDVAQVNSHDWAITARGFNTALANKLLVLIDGRSVYTPLFSGVFWERQDYLLADIDRIEVISGPGGTLWGANAVNGVINIITRSAANTQGTYLEADGGTQLEDLVAIRHGGSLSADVAFRVYGQYFNRDDELRSNGASNHDAWHKGQGGFRVDGQPSQHDAWTLQGDFYDGDEQIATGGAAVIRGGNLLGRWTHDTSADAGTSLQAYYDHTYLDDPIPPFVLGSTPLAPAGILTDDLDTWDVQFEQHAKPSPNQRLVWGAGYRHTRDVVGNAPSLGFFPSLLTQNLYSTFVQDEIRLRDEVAVTAGSKLEHNDYTGFEFEPSLRLQWNVENRMLWAAVSRAVRTPSRIDRDIAEPTPPAPIVVLQGNGDFTSETLIAREIGYRAQPDPALTLSISAFYNSYDDLRSTHFTPATFLPLVFANGLEGTTYGVEVSANYQVRDWWRLHGGLDLLHENIRVKPGQSDFNDAHNEIGDPTRRFSLRSSMDLPGAVELDTDLRWVGERILNMGPTLGAVPAYAELDLRVGWRCSQRLELSLTGRNLLHDHHAEYGFPLPTRAEIGRSVFAKMALRF